MRYRIKHITEYQYASRVSHCYNMAHLMPRNSRRQQCLSTHLDVQPGAVINSKREDYFGNWAHHFEIHQPHKKLRIVSTSDVETRDQVSMMDLDLGVTCAQARTLMQGNRDIDTLMAREFLLNSGMVRKGQTLVDYCGDIFTDDKPLLRATLELTQRIFTDFKYNPQATTIATPVEEVLENREGVCQDFAHLQIACLRSLGFAAKYVSGYLETLPPPGQEKMVGADASHAWISVYAPGEGWFEFDPTNNCMAAEQHIITAWGRDYYDVTPLCGVIFGGGENPILSVSVDVQRL